MPPPDAARDVKTIIAIVPLAACLDRWDPPIPETPRDGMPCGIDGVVCFAGTDAGVQPTGMCCDQGTVCGGGWPNVGCPLGGGLLINGASLAGASQIIYGPGIVNVVGGGSYHLASSNFTAALAVATLHLDGASAFDTYLPSTGIWVHSAGPFTGATIDTGGGAGGAGVQNARTGSRYSPVN
jgi:hypothetical protein